MPRFSAPPTERARTLAESLSTRDLLLQVATPALVHLDPQRLDAYGGIFLHGSTQEEMDDVLDRLRPLCPVRPFVVADIEHGPRDLPPEMEIDFGSMLANGVIDDPSLTSALGRATGALSRARGFTWSLAPCADLHGDPDSPMVGIRSAGRDPEKVAAITWAFAEGLQSEGILATAKHFPGDGFGTLDQHLTTPAMPLTQEQWRQGPGLVFRQLIDRGIGAIMPGHISFPARDVPDEDRGLYPPATLSKRLLTDLLRGEMGFQGLIVSDAVNMGGFCGFMNYYDACARFLEAGGDMLLFAKIDEYYFREMDRCLREGRLRESTLRERATRIIAVKERLGLLDDPGSPRAVDPRALGLPALAERFVAKSVGILRDRHQILPLSIQRSTRVLHVVIYNHHEQHKELLSTFTRLLREHSDQVTEWIDPGCDRLFEAARARAFDVIVCSIGGSIQYGANVIRLHGTVARNMMYGWMHLGVPTVFVAHHHPFLHLEYEAAIDCCVATLGSTPYALRHLVKGLTGAIDLPEISL